MVEGSSKACVIVPQTTLVRELPDGESVLLSMATERYFSLDQTGTEMWKALMSADSIEAALQQLVQGFDAAEDRIRADLHELVEKLASQGLIEIKPA